MLEVKHNNTEDQILEGWKSHFEQLAERSISENYDKDYLGTDHLT